MVLTTVLSMIRYVGEIDDRDFVDRLHSYFTTNILIGLSIIVSFKQFGGKPIECLVPDIFNSAWEQYAENYCWAQDTYYVPMSKVVDGMTRVEKTEQRISYYQWVPFFLLVEAAFFRLPSLLWKCMAGYSGIKIQEVVKLSSDPNNIKPEIKKANIKSLTVHLQGALRFHRRLHKKQIRPHRFLRMFNVPYTACFVSTIYILTKTLYLINVCFQLYLMNRFLETSRFSYFGLGAVIDLLNGKTWEQSGVFPRVSLCDFDVRVMGNTQQHTIQCVLVINIFNEKIFVFLWFWYMALMFFTACSLLYWLFILLLPYPNQRFINRHLEMSEMPYDPDENKKEVNRFINSYLKSDGLFVIRMLTLHAGVIFCTELVLSLWKSYFGIEEQLKRSSSFPAGATIWPPPPPPEKQISTLEIDDNDNRANILRLRKGAIGNIKEEFVTRLKAESEEFTALIAKQAPPPTASSAVSFTCGPQAKAAEKSNLSEEDSLVVHRASPSGPPPVSPKPRNISSPPREPNLIV